ncbi:hypothetical protein KEM60_00067 [Austwickia sp. TVS 96-490-7B]|uniref:hypothetical protein n=1 Tax=Austwickia sp. TVS 96-490-7B TaxID=2830843 RepID=UPI001C570773|nr:hypothetical protein [Austwickia sp. TVS 96-490-7B]MBW3083888.1 hypothetical protein [Austwickia sp. TVS 96-490-7B]
MRAKNRLVVASMSFLLLAVGIPTATAAEQPVSVPSNISVTSIARGADTQNAEAAPRAGASWAGKQGAKLLAKALRSPAADAVIDRINWGDKAAKAAVKANKGAVADVLDQIAKFTDIPAHVVKEKTFHMLLNAGLSGGNAKMISDTLGIIIGAII